LTEGFSSIAEILNKEPGLDKIRKVLKQSDVVREFSEIFPDLARIATAIKVEKNTLFLRVENSVWRNELKLRENLITEKVNGYFKEIRIEKVKFIP
jgi:hypothetical protein